ncbi:MAG TPA: PAS domain-containing sensor histidine kinase, partial [Alphaproteobacteria bacterium]|nr:PAS domain-containing sensor histidine kinase [Alphaproteobacteria bacterium]
LIKTRPFDVVIFDADLVAVDCKGACIKIDDIAPGMPKIVLAMTGEEAMKAKSCCSEAQDYLAWNHTSKKLLQRSIRQAIENHERQQTLRREHDFNAAIFDNMGGVAAVFDVKGRFVRINRAFKNVLGYSEADVLGKSARSFLARKRDIKTTAECLSKIFSKGISKNCETLWKTGTGGRRLISWSHSPLTDDGGDIRNIVCTGIDVTEQKRAEDALRESEELFAKIFFGNPVPVAIVGIDDDRLYEINYNWLKTFGYKREDILGKTPIELGLWVDHDRRIIFKNRILKKGRVRNFESRLKAKNGEERDFLISGEKMTIDNEKFMLTITNDITEIKKTEAALRDSEEMFAKAFNVNPSLILIVDAETGECRDVNKTFLSTMGLTREEVIGRTSLDFKLWDDPEEMDAFVKALGKNGFIRNYEKRLRTRKGGKKDFLFSGEVMEMGGRSCFLLAGIDITERKKSRKALRKAHDEMETKVIERTHQLQEVIEEQKQTAQSLRKASEMAEDASRTKTRFLANMSHELRTPLNAILGFSGAMSEKVFGPLGNDKYESYVDNIMESGRHLLELIEDVLDLSKIDAVAMNLNEETVDISKVVATSMNFIGPLANDKNISVESNINGSLPEIMADPLRVRQILINLLSNAVKFTHERGKVTIDARLDANGRMILSVTDTGIGMAAEDIPEALSEFGQLDSTLAREGQGTGLGLPLSRQLMHLHGGSLVIESREGEGTRVDAIFPKTRVLP